MNITDIDPHDLPPVDGDMLLEMFRIQSRLEDTYRQIEGDRGFFPNVTMEMIPLDLNRPPNNWFLKDAAQRVIEEMCEGTNVLKNKQWKRTPTQVDAEHVYEELADTWAFLVRYTLFVLGRDEAGARRMFELFRRKHTVNEFRQRTQY